MSVTLVKNQTVSLVKPGNGAPLTRIRMGLAWRPIGAEAQQPVKRGLFGRVAQAATARVKDVDLDASVIMFDERKNQVDVVSYSHLRSNDGSIQHTGDDLTGRGGHGDGDNESVNVDLSRVSSEVKTLVFTVNSYTGETFSQVATARCRLMDLSGSNEAEVGRFELATMGTEFNNATGLIMAAVTRDSEGDGWSMKMLGVPGAGRVARDLISLAQGLV